MSKDERSNAELLEELKEAFEREGLTYRASTHSWVRKGRGLGAAQLKDLAAYWLSTSPNRIGVLLTVFSDQERQTAFGRAASWLAKIESYTTDDSELRRWLRHIVAPDTTEMELEAHVMVMKQWIWQVKQAIVMRDAVWHVTPVFHTREGGTGKSYNLKRLLSPLKDFTRTLGVDELGERFSGRLFADTFICFLDEFAGAEKANAATLKAVLTGKPFDQRTPHSDSGFYSDNRMSCIATSNLEPPHGFVDETGARRFWSIRCNPSPMEDGSERMEALDTIRLELVWAAVSVEDDPPHYACSSEVRAHIDRVRDEVIRTRTSLQNFVEEGIEEIVGGKISLKAFREAYGRYCHAAGLKKMTGSYAKFIEALTQLGVKVTNKGNTPAVHGYQVLPEFDSSGCL